MSVQSVVKLVNLTQTQNRRDSGLTRVLGSMTKLFSKNIARSTDLLFLKSLVGSNQCIKHEEKIIDEEPLSDLPVSHDSMRLIEQAKTICEQRIYLDEAKELYSLISSKWLHAVLEIHDEVAALIQNNTEEVEYIDGVSSIEEENEDEDDDMGSNISTVSDGKTEEEKEEPEEVQIDTFRVIGVRRKKGECLGLTVRVEEGKLVVARILIDSIIDRQGLVHPGDFILQANGRDVKDPEKLQQAIEDSGEFIVFKIQPSSILEIKPGLGVGLRSLKAAKDSQFFVRAMFDYNPQNDNLLPCQDIGLTFKYGDILEIVNWTDPSWWQARKVNSSERPGLVPSQDLEERRQCFFLKSNGMNNQVSCCGTSSRKEKSKLTYMVRDNLNFDKAELLLYEAVEKMPPFSRKTLALVSPSGIPKQTLVHKLVDSNKDVFGTTIPLTSRPMGDYEMDGESCWFVSAERMQEGMAANEFLDMGEHDNYLFGTTLQSVRDVINKENKLCILDCRPEALKHLHNSCEFLPFVIFLSAKPKEIPKTDDENEIQQDIVIEEEGKSPSQDFKMTNLDPRQRRLFEESEQIRHEFQKYFDLEIEFQDVDLSFVKIKETLDKLASETQWVPRNWVYS